MAEAHDLTMRLESLRGSLFDIGKGGYAGTIAEALAEISRLQADKERLDQTARLADAALAEAEAILGGEYGDQYGALLTRIENLRDLLGADAPAAEGDWVKLTDARRSVDACGGTHPPGQEEYGRGYDAALTEADAALVRLGKEGTPND